MNIIEEDGSIIIKNIKDFDISQTLECGQCFHFKKINENEYGLCAYGKLLHIKQCGNDVIMYNTSIYDYDNIWKNYFDFERNYSSIKNALLKTDNLLKEAIDTMWGVRILNQEFLETLISFIISQNKQIPHIKKIVADISEKYGDYLGKIENEEFYSFPTLDQMKNVTIEELRDLKTGFRAPYIADAVRLVIEKGGDSKFSEYLWQISVSDCENELTQIKGVGNKVANCVMLFSLGKRESFPVDVWIKRIIEHMYFEGKDTDKETLYKFARKHFGKYGGYAQQYLFYYGKTMNLGKQRK